MMIMLAVAAKGVEVMGSIIEGLGRLFAYQVLHPPRRRPHRDPGDLCLDWVEASVETSDGLRLACWLVGPNSENVAIVGHGIRQGKSASLRNAELLVGRGMQVLMFDHRGHGDSEGDRRAWRVADRFTDDITSCVRWVEQQPVAPRRVIVWGYSFSTFPTVYALASGSISVHGIVCESGPGFDLAGMFEMFLENAARGGAPLGKLMRSARLRRCTAQAAVEMLGASWPPEAGSGGLTDVPQLYLVGDRDAVIGAGEVRRLVDGWPAAEAWEVPGGHLRLIESGGESYREIVYGFLDRLAADGSSPT